MTSRISFEEAIEEKLLLKNRFYDLAFPQRVLLKMLYGVELSKRKVDPVTGFSELDYWKIFHKAVERDELGYPTKVLHDEGPEYQCKEFREAWLIIGRRGGKTDAFASTIVAYEATLGGHETALRPRQQGICFQIAQDLRVARNALHFIRAVLESSPILVKEIVQITADRIDLKNRFTIACVPATLKSVRGFASPVAVLDEVGVWYQEADSANPDYEIYRALSPGQIQFPNRKIVGISSPWNKAGMLYQYYEAGTEGWKCPVPSMRGQYQDVLVVSGPTAMMGNPQVEREFLRKERERNETAFERELLAEFQDSISGFIPTALVNQAVDFGVHERPPKPGVTYYAAMDPAFKRDAFGFTIVHNEGGVIVQDAARRFLPRTGEVLSPAAVLDMLVPLAKSYGCSVIHSDQYQFEALKQQVRDRGMEVFPVTFTSKSKAQLFGNLQQLFLQRKIRILDDYETIREVKALERTLTGGGTVAIAAPAGQHDDMAAVLAIAVSQAMFEGTKTEEPAQTRHKEYQRLIDEQIRRKWEAVQQWEGGWD